MFGAISVKMIRELPSPLRRARSTKSRDVSENVCARSARAAQGHEVSPMKIASVMIAADLQVGGDDEQERERRDDEDDVREHVQHLVDDAAPVAGGEADDHADDRGDAAAERPDEEGEAQAVDELGIDVLAERASCRTSSRPSSSGHARGCRRTRAADAARASARRARTTSITSVTPRPKTSFRLRSAK